MLDEALYVLTRFWLQRAIGAVYLIAFLVALNQFRPLLGERGLLPVPDFVKHVHFFQSPSLFHFHFSDRFFVFVAALGLLLSTLALTGISDRFGTSVSISVWATLYVLYLSIVNVGQTFYGFGWESILLEAGFLAIFLGWTKVTPSFLVILLFRWLLFRMMFGAGLIKLRSDPCWWDLTCLQYHHETQPMPNPLSWTFHHLPPGVHRAGVLVNHAVELVIPFGYFFPQPIAGIAGLVTMLFQGTLIASGNFSWLNWLTVALALSTLSDRFLPGVGVLTGTLVLRPPAFDRAVLIVTGIFALLSVFPVVNMFSRRQLMNFSFNPFHLVSTYGAFGSITKQRLEVLVEGTDDPVPRAESVWKAYEFKGKPGDVRRRPPLIAPYHLRLDWLMWFLPFTPDRHEPWFLRFVEKILEGDRAVLGLIRHNPFPTRPPRWIRAEFYHYRYTTPAERRATGAWWTRERVGAYLPPVSLDQRAPHTPRSTDS